jgi:peptidoglycan/xylan/chitin deacetylase (PgdA/CDA1 family)
MYSLNLKVLYRVTFVYLILFIASFNNQISATSPSESEEVNVPQPILEVNEEVGEIALSLDDAPMPSTVIFSGMEKTKRIIQALQEANCPAIGIFAIGQYTQRENNMWRLHMYAQAGHIIANHTYSHPKLNNITTQEFIADVKKAHAILSPLPNFRPLFRFPYLAEGKDKVQRQEVIEALKDMGYREGYITVNNHDYYINKLLLDAVKAGKVVDYDKLRDLYITILWDCIQANQKIAYKVLKRKVKHVLLLHENDLAALFIGDLIAHIRKQGWKIISIEEAYEDPIADFPVTNTYSLVGRLGAIAIEKGLGKKLAVFPETVDYNYIPKALRQQQIFSNPTS